VHALAAFGDRVIVAPGRAGFNAVVNTGLEDILRERGIRASSWPPAGAQVTAERVSSPAR
jgi:hypothetical protein